MCAALWLAGCATIQWYGQAVRGQLELLAKREAIEPMLTDPRLPESTKRKLQLALDVREFATRELHLPDNDSYRSYVALDRDAVVWNVLATPEFSVEPRTWCYPLVGCLAYRGWFRQEAARRQAARLRERGLDVRVSPVAAYSTLGRFDDPVTSAMLAWDDPRLAGLILHELAHQRMFVSGDTAFNEAFATTVERAGLDRWLAARNDTATAERIAAGRTLDAEFTALMLDTRRRLAELYAGPLEPDAMRAAKANQYESMRARYAEFRQRTGSTRYDRWMARDLNNADLALIATYERGVSAFGALLAEYDGDFAAFFEAVDRLADQPAETREAFLNSCRTTACP